MARGGNFSSSNYLMGDLSIAAPISFSLWIKNATVSANQVVVAASVYTGATANGIGIRLGSTSKPTLIVDNAGSITSTAHADATPNDAWCHIYGGANATDTRHIAINGSYTSATSGSNAITGSIAKLQLAALHWNSGANNLHAQYYQGVIAELAVYNTLLTIQDVTQLSKGLSPLLIRPDALVWYVPLIRGDASGNDYNRFDGTALTETGTVNDAAHVPNIYRPAPPWVVSIAVASVQDIDLDFVSSTETVNSPTVTTSQEVLLDFVSSTEVVNSLTIASTQNIDLGFVSSTEVVNALAHLEMYLTLAFTSDAGAVGGLARIQTAADDTTPDERKWVVEVENRTWIIEAEDRTWIIEGA